MKWTEKVGSGGIALAIIVLIVGLNYDVTKDTYYCDSEPDKLLECEFGLSGGKETRCYLNEEHSSWDYCGTGWIKVLDHVKEVKKGFVVDEIFSCETSYFNISEDIYSSCTKFNYTDDCMQVYPNGTCQFWHYIPYTSTCFDHVLIIEKNKTVCSPIGFNVSYDSNISYEITGECCGYFNSSNQIVCKEVIDGICNPVCQQSSPNPNVFDEYCTIYDLGDKSIISELVGSYGFVEKNKIKLSDKKVK